MIINNKKINATVIETKKTGPYQKIFFELENKKAKSNVIVVFDTIKNTLGLVWINGQKDIENFFDLSKKPKDMSIEKYIDLKEFLTKLWIEYKLQKKCCFYYEEVSSLYENSKELKRKEGPTLSKVKRRLSLDQKNPNKMIKIYSDKNRKNLVSYKKGQRWFNTVEV